MHHTFRAHQEAPCADFFNMPVFPADRWPTQLFQKNSWFFNFYSLFLPNLTHLLSLQIFWSFLLPVRDSDGTASNKPFQRCVNFFIFKLKLIAAAAQAKNRSLIDIWYAILFWYATCVHAAPLCSPRLQGWVVPLESCLVVPSSDQGQPQSVTGQLPQESELISPACSVSSCPIQ